MARGTTVVRSTQVVSSAWVVCLMALMLAGCQSKTAPTKENFTAALDSYYAAGHDDCLFPGGLRFPYEVSAKGKVSDSSVTAKQLDALTEAGMLEKFNDKDLHIDRYSPTAAGTRATSRFCYGHRVLSAIDSSTEPTRVNGFPEVQVTYHYTVVEVPMWAKSAGIQAAFPEMGKALHGGAQGTAKLSQTLAGWQVPE